ncbi:hypothetical protein X801_06075, partial [Opisthorchis viverrini]
MDMIIFVLFLGYLQIFNLNLPNLTPILPSQVPQRDIRRLSLMAIPFTHSSISTISRSSEPIFTTHCCSTDYFRQPFRIPIHQMCPQHLLLLADDTMYFFHLAWHLFTNTRDYRCFPKTNFFHLLWGHQSLLLSHLGRFCAMFWASSLDWM